MKKQSVAGWFALLFGVFGLHRFYLGQRVRGILTFALTVLAFIISVEENAPVVMIPVIIGFIDALLFFFMPREDFDEKYNQKYLRQAAFRDNLQASLRKPPATPTFKQPVVNTYKSSGIEKFREYDIEGALADFKKSLEDKFDDPAVHFNLACCYSLLERPDPAFFHLSKAIHFGFVDFDKIEKHDSLAFLRTLPEFSEFVKKGYQSHKPVEKENLKEVPAADSGQDNLLDQIKRLAELRERGILTEAEFMSQTKQVLRQ